MSADAPEAIEITGEPTAVYRFYDAAGALLYVGISRNLVARWAQHEVEKTWWSAVARKTVTMYGSRREAEIAEGHAIRSESPLHNKAMGRRDETEPKPKPKKPVRKPSPTHKDRIDATRLAKLQPRSFMLDDEFLARIDAYAKEHDHDRDMAFRLLLFTGLVTAEEDDAKHKARLEALRSGTMGPDELRALAAEFDLDLTA